MKYWAHFVLSAIFMVIAAGLCAVLVVSYSSSRLKCSNEGCEVWEKDGLVAASHRVWRSARPVSLAIYHAAQETPALYVVSVHGDSQRITSLNETVAQVNKIKAELSDLPAGTDYLVSGSSVSWEWYVLAVLVTVSAGINLYGSLRALINRP
jgi:hypothetical protein